MNWNQPPSRLAVSLLWNISTTLEPRPGPWPVRDFLGGRYHRVNIGHFLIGNMMITYDKPMEYHRSCPTFRPKCAEWLSGRIGWLIIGTSCLSLRFFRSPQVTCITSTVRVVSTVALPVQAVQLHFLCKADTKMIKHAYCIWLTKKR